MTRLLSTQPENFMHKLVISVLAAAFAFLVSTSSMATPQTAPVANALKTAVYGTDGAVLMSFSADAWQTLDTAQVKRTFAESPSSANGIAPIDAPHNGLAMLAALVIIGSIVVRRFLR
jgi:hypothetical protein